MSDHQYVVYSVYFTLELKSITAAFNLLYGLSCGSDDKESACDAGDPGWSLGLGRSLEKGMEIHSSIPAWTIPWKDEPGGLHTVHMVAKSKTGLKD